MIVVEQLRRALAPTPSVIAGSLATVAAARAEGIVFRRATCSLQLDRAEVARALGVHVSCVRAVGYVAEDSVVAEVRHG